ILGYNRETKVTKKVDIYGILGNRDSKLGKSSIPRRRQWVKRRETWLVILGVILNSVYMLSIFDIYFTTPFVHGLDLVSYRFSPPAKRLVLLVGKPSFLLFLGFNPP
ncbi:hypothetical protein V6Z12_D01G179400, partial [Gossypium hirsutum]